MAVLGVAFIEDSDDPRNTPTRDFVKILSDQNIPFMVHDPFVRQEEVEFSFTNDLQSVLNDADAIVIITAHQMYKKFPDRGNMHQETNSWS